MKDIYILGSGGFAKEVYYLIREINKKNATYKFCGFVDLKSVGNLKIGSFNFPIIGEEEFIKSYSDKASLAIGIGNPQIIQNLFNKFGKISNFPNLISPNADGDWESIKLGVGNIITSGCRFTVDIEIGSFNIFNLNATIGHDTLIESFNVINPGVNLSGNVKIGSRNLFGTNATILQSLTIANDIVIGAGCTATKDLIEAGVYVGSPVRQIK